MFSIFLDRGRRRSRSRDRHDRHSRSDRNSRNRHDRPRNDDRDKRTKWDSTETVVAAQQGSLIGNNMSNMNMGMMPGNFYPALKKQGGSQFDFVCNLLQDDRF